MHKHPEEWYIAYTYPKQEKKVHQLLSGYRQVHSFLPLQTTYRQWSDRVKKIRQPLFPNYIFVKTSLNQLGSLQNMDGVVRFLSFDNKYAKITEKEIKSIQLMLDNCPESIVREEDVFKTGEKVRVVQGPFKGFVGELFKNGSKSRLNVRIAAINQNLSFEIPSYCVERIPNHI